MKNGLYFLSFLFLLASQFCLMNSMEREREQSPKRKAETSLNKSNLKKIKKTFQEESEVSESMDIDTELKLDNLPAEITLRIIKKIISTALTFEEATLNIYNFSKINKNNFQLIQDNKYFILKKIIHKFGIIPAFSTCFSYFQNELKTLIVQDFHLFITYLLAEDIDFQLKRIIDNFWKSDLRNTLIKFFLSGYEDLDLSTPIKEAIISDSIEKITDMELFKLKHKIAYNYFIPFIRLIETIFGNYLTEDDLENCCQILNKILVSFLNLSDIPFESIDNIRVRGTPTHISQWSQLLRSTAHIILNSIEFQTTCCFPILNKKSTSIKKTLLSNMKYGHFSEIVTIFTYIIDLCCQENSNEPLSNETFEKISILFTKRLTEKVLSNICLDKIKKYIIEKIVKKQQTKSLLTMLAKEGSKYVEYYERAQEIVNLLKKNNMAELLNAQQPVLSIAVQLEDIELIDTILKNRTKKQGGLKRVFSEALEIGNIEIIKKFSKYVDINDLKHGGNQTPLIWAITRNYKELVKLILNLGADVNQIASTKNNTFIPIIEACKKYDLELIELFLNSKNINLNVEDSYSGQTPLMMIIYRIHLINCYEVNNQSTLENLYKILNSLVKSSAIDLNYRQSKTGETALMKAVELQDLQSITMLIEAGANINISNNDQETALIIANKIGNQTIIDLIVHSAAKKA